MGRTRRRFATAALAVAALASLGVSAAAAPSFEPTEGLYRGEYTSGDHGPGKVRLRVEQLRPRLHGVRLLKWSGELTCPGGETETVDVGMVAARNGKTFNGVASYTSPPAKHRFTGRFTTPTSLKATVRVTEGSGADRCDTGPVSFEAQLVAP